MNNRHSNPQSILTIGGILTFALVVSLVEAVGFPSVRLCDPSCGRGVAPYLPPLLGTAVAAVVVSQAIRLVARVRGDGDD